MEELEVRWLHALQIWWAWLWRTAVWVLPISFAIGLVGGFTFVALEISIQENLQYFKIVSGAVGAYFSVKVLKKILNKTFNGYRIALIKVEQPTKEA